jgi:hypothetical protein
MDTVCALWLCENFGAVSWYSVIFLLCIPLHLSKLAVHPTQLSSYRVQCNKAAKGYFLLRPPHCQC